MTRAFFVGASPRPRSLRHIPLGIPVTPSLGIPISRSRSLRHLPLGIPFASCSVYSSLVFGFLVTPHSVYSLPPHSVSPSLTLGLFTTSHSVYPSLALGLFASSHSVYPLPPAQYIRPSPSVSSSPPARYTRCLLTQYPRPSPPVSSSHSTRYAHYPPICAYHARTCTC